MSIFSDQRAFMEACEQLFSEGLNCETGLWKTLIQEEYNELFHAITTFQQQPVLNKKACLVKEAIDVIYVVAGLLNNLCVPADEVWRAVHESNMAKLADGKAIRRSDGKILKPVGWKAPDITLILLEHHSAHRTPR